jgi:transketolase
VRTAFIEALRDAARADSRIILVTGDLGFGVVTDFRDEMPAQFVNAGVAEQNMTGMAAGMALSGKTVVTYSIANFPTLRCFEQVRNDVCYHRADVKIVSVGGGFAYGALGASHHATEDIAVMRTLPNLLVLAPNDPIETRLATRAMLAHRGPCYLRLGRAGEPIVHEQEPAFELGRAITVREGRDLTLVATGGMLRTSIDVADRLAEAGLSTRVLSMHTIKPLDDEAILAASRETRALFTIEEHSVIGGLGGAVAERLLEAPERPAVFKRIGIPGQFTPHIGDQQYLRGMCGLDAAGILATIGRSMNLD